MHLSQNANRCLNKENYNFFFLYNSNKKYVSSYLESKGMEKGYETPKVKFSFRKSPALNVYDAVSLRKYIDEDEDRKKKYYKYSEPEISKKAITDDLKADENLTIPGAEIISKKNLQIK